MDVARQGDLGPKAHVPGPFSPDKARQEHKAGDERHDDPPRVGSQSSVDGLGRDWALGCVRVNLDRHEQMHGRDQRQPPRAVPVDDGV